MRIRVLFFGILKDLTGRADEFLDLPEHATLVDVLRHYEKTNPRWKDLMASIAMSVNREYAGPKAKLKQDEGVELLSPVIAGSGDAPGLRTFRRTAIVREKIDTQAILDGIKQPEN